MTVLNCYTIQTCLHHFRKIDIMAKFVIALLVLVAVYAAEGKIQDQIIST